MKELLDSIIDRARESGITDYDDIIKFVIGELDEDVLITEDQKRELLTILLKAYLQKHTTNQVHQSTVRLRKVRDPHYVGKRGERIHSWWQNFLKTYVTVKGEQMAHADLTVDDLRWLSKQRAKLAEEYNKKSQEYAEYANALAKSGKSKLGQLESDPLK